MKNTIYLLLLMIFGLGSLSAQPYSYEMKMENFEQVSESEIQWDVFLRKGDASDPWALYTMQIRWQYDEGIYNTGTFESGHLTLITDETDLYVRAGWFSNSDFTKVNNGGIDYLNWATTVAPAPDDAVTVFNDDQWKKVARFSAQLRKDGAAHNFADMDPLFAFQSSGLQLIVRRCGYSGANPNATMSGSGNFEIDPLSRDVSPVPGTKVNDRQLAGYWFSGDGTWSTTARWNNVTNLHANELPGANSNAIINGNCNILGTSALSLLPNSGDGGELTVLTGPSTKELIADGTDKNKVIYTDDGLTELTNPLLGAEAGAARGIMKTRDDLYASLTISPNGALTVDKLFNDNINGAPAILVESTIDGTGSLIHNFDNVPATIQRYMPASNSEPIVPVYHTVSVPLTAANNPESILFLWSYLFEFNVDAQDWVALGTPTNTPLNVDQGYLVIKDVLEPGGTTIPDPTYSFAGTINNGSFSCNVTYPVAATYKKNLVPNPYPSAIDWDAGISAWTKTNIDNGIWIWNPTSGNYATYSSSIGTNGGTRYIPVGQSFFVSANASSPELTMNNNARVHNSQNFFKHTDDVVDLLRIKAKGNGFSDEIIVRFLEESTPTYDGSFDVIKFYGNSDAPQVFSMAEDANELSINSLPYTSDVMEIPLGFKLEDESGLCTFEASSIESFDPTVSIFLEDILNGNMINLRQTSEYSFFHDPNNDPLRFKLIINGVTAVAEEKSNNQQFYYSDELLYLDLSTEISGNIEIFIYNVNGQLEMVTSSASGKSIVPVPGLKQGAYMVQLISQDQSLVRKIMVK